MSFSSACRTMFITVMSGSLALAGSPVVAQSNVPWAKPAKDKPAAPQVDPEWAGVTFAIDKDEWRDTPRRHRYVHGCFSPSHLCVSLYLPPKELYRGRFVEHMEGGPGGLDKMMTQPGWEWAFNTAFDDMGAYLVETNEGHYPDEGSGLDTSARFGLQMRTASARPGALPKRCMVERLRVATSPDAAAAVCAARWGLTIIPIYSTARYRKQDMAAGRRSDGRPMCV
jgi:hypothetical protein